ncbi:DUF4920 domain-containing protein [Tamlana sp. 2201CG12-4]|uniref:DUF4920 domain-containing protein n=1 Tax=Tamlana sp. 2201CG12-4 TaxID=3112582 RepID=UPI002DB83347|nr:DUF4920 domain-containing protein [Tamlana sp. 2201CG12-4]MEC3907561.1 DUF4920 domain-containing protein [Tamlana sp. 2201CG12-4]
MKSVILLLFCVLTLSACKNKSQEIKDLTGKVENVAYKSFGEKINTDDVITGRVMVTKYKVMKVGDSTPSKLIAKVNDVCQAKGCWMRLAIDDEQEVMVKFKDYGFFVPKDIKGKQVIVSGKAYIKEVSVDEQRHYAEDAGQSKEEIAKIMQPKQTFSFEADGVLVAQ